MTRLPKKRKFDFFLAYAKKDEKTALKIYEKLILKSTVFLSKKNLVAGDDWDIVIPEAQKNSKITIVLISNNSNKAFYQREEIAAAIDMAREGNHRVVPLFISDPENLANTPYGLKIKQSISMFNESELDSAVQELIALLSSSKPANNLLSKEITVKTEDDNKILKIIFSNSDLYPHLNFSIGNTSDEEIQITNIKVIKLASAYYDDPNINYMQSPRSTLNYSLNTKQGNEIVFGNDSVEYIPSKKFAAFQIKFTGEYVMSLLDIEIEYVSINMDSTDTIKTGCLILVKALYDSGCIQVVKRNELIKFLKNLDTVPRFNVRQKNDQGFGYLIAKNADRVWQNKTHEMWKVWANECYDLSFFPEGMLSFAEMIGIESLPDEFIIIIYNWLKQYKKYLEYPLTELWNIVAKNSSTLPVKIPGYAHFFKLIDESINDAQAQQFRETIIGYLSNDLGSVQYIMAIMLTKPELWERIVIHTLIEILRSSKSNNHDSIIKQYKSIPMWPLENDELKFQLWENWWKENSQLEIYNKLEWKNWSPNILKKLQEKNMSNYF